MPSPAEVALLFLLLASCASSQVSKLAPSNPISGAQFGTSVALSVDASLLAVGAPATELASTTSAGSVYVYFATQAADGLVWQDEVELRASDATSNDRLGSSVAVDRVGSRIASGAVGETRPGVSSAGAVYVFTLRDGRDGRAVDDWDETKVVAFDPVAAAYFGSSLSMSGDGAVLVVGAYGVNSEQGAVYVTYLDEAGSETGQVKLVPDESDIWDRLGWAVAVSGDGTVVAASMDRDDTDTISNVGSVVVWKCRSGARSCVEARKVRPTDGEEDDAFGTSVSLTWDGSLLAVGSPYSTSNFGAVYLYSTSSWSVTKVLASDGVESDLFAHAVALSADGRALAVGAKQSDDIGSDVGKGYLYSKPVTGDWHETILKPVSIPTSSFLGHSVAVQSSAVVLGAFRETVSAQRSGAVRSYGCPLGHKLDIIANECSICAMAAECPSVAFQDECPAGFYASEGDAVCTPCPPNTACPLGATAPSLCPTGNRATSASDKCTECRDIHRLEPAADGETCQFKSALGVPQEPIIVLGVLLVFVIPLAVGSAGLAYRDILTFVIATADIMSDVLYVTTQPFVNPVVHFAAIFFLLLPWVVMNVVFPPRVCNRPVGWLDVHGLARGRQRGFVESIREAYAAEYERLLQPPTRASIEAARDLFGSLLEDLVEFFKDTFLDLDSRFWKWPPKNYNKWDTPAQIAAAPLKVLVFILATVVTPIIIVVGVLYFMVAVLLCVVLTPVWAIFQALMFLFAPVLPVIARAVYGQFLLLTKLVSVQKASDHWLPWWRGERVSSTVSSRVFAKLVYIELFLESMPQLVIQSVNNVGQWNPFAYASLVLSIVVVLHSLRVIAKNMLQSSVSLSKNRGVWEQAQEVGETLLSIKFLSVAKAQAARGTSSTPPVVPSSSSSSVATTRQVGGQAVGGHRGSLQLISFST